MTNTTTGIQNPTDMSDYDWLEFVSFVWKVGREGYSYAVENYGPKFDDPRLPCEGLELKVLYSEYRGSVDAWWDAVGGQTACDLVNAHVDESRQREKDACLWGIRCTDGHVITANTEAYRDSIVAYLKVNGGNGWREPAALLHREVPGGEWTEETSA